MSRNGPKLRQRASAALVISLDGPRGRGALDRFNDAPTVRRGIVDRCGARGAATSSIGRWQLLPGSLIRCQPGMGDH